jgi:hypothetical protein
MCLAIGAPAVQADDAVAGTPVSVNLGAEYFRWSEYYAGQRLLRETGERLTLGIAIDHLLEKNNNKSYAAEIRGYTGTVDYDGQTMSGIPARADVDYTGVSGEIMWARRMSATARTSALFGLGFDTWTRDIKNGVTAFGSPVLGYEEDYLILYGKLGPGFHFGDGAMRSYLQVGIKYPLYTKETAHLSTIGFDSDVDLKPGRQISGFAKWRMKWGGDADQARLGASIYYESFRFNTSGTSQVTAGGVPFLVIQPESRMDVVGARLEFCF